MPASAEPVPGRTFGRVAESYARTRPPYPRAAIDRAAAELWLAADAVVLDLAAGTGTLTRALRGRFAEVLAVEPDAGMRERFEGNVLAGTAEAIPLADASVDAVFVGEAFHWFDYEAAHAEIRRVARSGLAILARSWGLKEQPGLLPAPFERDLDDVWRRFHADRTSRDFPHWDDVVRPDGHARFVDVVTLSGRDLVDLHLTASTPASIPAPEREAIARRAYPLMDDEYDLRVVTELSWKRFT